mmetsp:Transcript_22087/g.39341  ORF Transcript_22087/g.39341 Transcript_22087/m.39341 type:complete len:134 (+) Transcript_22087:55-456(+)
MSWLWTFGRVPELNAQGLLNVSRSIAALSEEERLLSKTPRIIDVRTETEYKSGHIPFSLNASFLPPWNWENKITPLLQTCNQDTEIYVVCLSAHRSIGALKWLNNKGYRNIKQLEGGMKAWRSYSFEETLDVK